MTVTDPQMQRNEVVIMVTRPDFLVAKEKNVSCIVNC